jgi:hypothetical protein
MTAAMASSGDPGYGSLTKPFRITTEAKPMPNDKAGGINLDARGFPPILEPDLASGYRRHDRRADHFFKSDIDC